MIKKRFKKLTPVAFISKVTYAVNKAMTSQNNAQRRIGELNAEYVRLYSPYKPGDVIDLPPDAKEGYDKFTIEKIVPRISDHVNEGKEKAYQITFDFGGIYKGEGQEDVKGILKTTMPKKEEKAL